MREPTSRTRGCAQLDDLYSRLGFGKIEPRQVLARVLGGGAAGRAASSRAGPAAPGGGASILPFGGAGPIAVKGQGDLLAYLAKCCNPLPGEEIVGYVTRGRGVSVHSVDCPNVRNLLYNPEREIEVEWADAEGRRLPGRRCMIETEDQPGMLARLTEAIAKQDSNIRIEAETIGAGRAGIEVVIEVRDSASSARLRETIESLPGVSR